MQVEIKNPFLKYLNNLPLLDIANEIKSLTIENIKVISQNALMDESKNFSGAFAIDGTLLGEVVPLSLNLKTYRFVPFNAFKGAKAVTDYLASWMPTPVWNNFGWEEEDIDHLHTGENINYFLEFLASSLDTFSEMEVDECCEVGIDGFVELEEERISFFQYFLKKSSRLTQALAYLSLYYRREESQIQVETKTIGIVNSEILGQTGNLLNSLKACSLLLEGLKLEESYSYTGSFCSETDLYPLLEIKKFAPLKNILAVNKHPRRVNYIKAKLEPVYLDFFAACLRMREEELDQFCQEIRVIITDTRRNKGRGVRFLGELRKNFHFYKIHVHCAQKLLLQQKSRETEIEEF